MATRIGIGFSKHPDPAQAAQAAATEAKNQVNTTTTDLVIPFATQDYATPEVLERIHRVLRPERLIGCSSAGLILPEQIEMKGIGILAIASDDMFFGIGTASGLGGHDLRQAGFEMARQISNDFKHPHRHGCVFFADGSFQNNTMFVRGAQEVLGNGFLIAGAVSTTEHPSARTRQFFQQQCLQDAATGMIIGGQIKMVVSSQHGWRPLGKPRAVTRVDGHVIRTINNEPAIQIYREYFGQEADLLETSKMSNVSLLYPLGIYSEEENGYILRNPVEILGDGSIVCQGEVPVDSEVHLMIGNKDSCKEAALKAALEIQDKMGPNIKLLLLFESIARHKVLGRSALQEIKIIRDVLGAHIPLIGMYCYGEIAPFQMSDNMIKTHLQNESLIITALG